MKRYIEERTIELARYILQKRTTVRGTAKVFGLSKSCVHYSLTNLLPELDLGLFYKVADLLDFNLKERHIRGGESTKRKYKRIAA